MSTKYLSEFVYLYSGAVGVGGALILMASEKLFRPQPLLKSSLLQKVSILLLVFYRFSVSKGGLVSWLLCVIRFSKYVSPYCWLW